MLQALQDLVAAIAHDLVQPNARVHGDEQCTVVDVYRLRVARDGGVNRLVPHFHHLCLGAASVELECSENVLHHSTGAVRLAAVRLLQRSHINAAPLTQNPVARAEATRPATRPTA